MHQTELVQADDDWQAVLASAARVQRLLPDAVLVDETASAPREDRVSYDHDRVLADLRARFDAVLEALEATDGWVTARVPSPVLILGSLDGVETGIRQLIRERPVETESFDAPSGSVVAPTLAECLRIKAWLVLRRNATRDYLDLAALGDQLDAGAVDALASMDEYYADQRQDDGDRIATQLAKQLSEPMPYDLSRVDLAHYRGLATRWRDWDEVRRYLQELSVGLVERAPHRPEDTGAPQAP